MQVQASGHLSGTRLEEENGTKPQTEETMIILGELAKLYDVGDIFMILSL
jgi:hypothetical protein